jgi:hypothetical protein
MNICIFVKDLPVHITGGMENYNRYDKNCQKEAVIG